jgi:uncharacterized damage-inducible protein DinB
MTIQHSAVSLLEQLKAICKALEPEDFRSPVPELSEATIGQHIRHALEFYICLMDGRNNRIINYDLRKHDQHIANDPALAQSVIQSVQEFLEKSEQDFSITYEANFSLDEGENVRMPSSFFRELAYNIEHTIHHMALLKIAITQHFPYCHLPDHFGIASSTLRYLRKENA